jgi:threonine/homoserine/homoserine lactone efflux protein
MTDWGVLGAVFAVHVLAMVSPGPNVLVVTQVAASATRRAGVWTALGIAAGAGLMSGAALAGLSVVLAQFAWLHAALRLVGGLYLVYLGFRLLRGAAAPLVFARGGALAAGDRRAFRLGLLTNVTNPKALLFYGSVFAALFAPSSPTSLKIAAVAVIVANSTAFHVALACLFSTARAQAGYRRVKPWVDRIAGVGLAALGLRLVLPR